MNNLFPVDISAGLNKIVLHPHAEQVVNNVVTACSVGGFLSLHIGNENHIGVLVINL